MKKRVVVILGGASSEHEISLISGANIADSIDREKYDVDIIAITREGEWLFVENTSEIREGRFAESKIKAVFSPDAKETCYYKISKTDGASFFEKVKVDVVFPALHGLFGEDGTIQGLFEMAKLPYVGCGVLASAVSMDKWFTKKVVDDLGIRQAGFVPVYKEELSDIQSVLERIEASYPYPYFVKPSNAGSSKGVSKATDRESLKKALFLAAEHDRKILVEETIVGRELEVAVLGGYEAKASAVGEILSAADFYDYDAKYNNAESKTVISPELPEGVEEEIKENAIRIFKALDGYGLSRVDFFLEKDTNELVFNEINTLPGFTSISMYPMLWGAEGRSQKELVGELIELALKRYEG